MEQSLNYIDPKRKLYYELIPADLNKQRNEFQKKMYIVFQIIFSSLPPCEGGSRVQYYFQKNAAIMKL